jgi:predicted Zn-ribbon and HTH transcriptional regulator
VTMGAPVKCKDCGARWYRMGMAHDAPCPDCGGENVDVDVRKPRKAKTSR